MNQHPCNNSSLSGAVDPPDVTVVVPVYNAGCHLDACLESILSQTLPRIEILCVDDHSTDGSTDILAAYGKSDSRVRVLSNPGKGAAAARNVGLEHARGRYVWFADADDSAEPTLCDRAVAAAESRGADVVVFRYDGIAAVDGVRLDVFAFPWLWPWSRGRFGGTGPAGRLTFRDVAGSVWNKLFRTQFLRDRRIVFPPTRTAEDTAFVAQALVATRRWVPVNEVLYHYRRGMPQGLLASREDGLLDFCEAWRYLLERLEALGGGAADRNWLIAHAFARIVKALRASTSMSAFSMNYADVRNRWLPLLGVDGHVQRMPEESREAYLAIFRDIMAEPDAFLFLVRRAH